MLRRASICLKYNPDSSPFMALRDDLTFFAQPVIASCSDFGHVDAGGMRIYFYHGKVSPQTIFFHKVGFSVTIPAESLGDFLLMRTHDLIADHQSTQFSCIPTSDGVKISAQSYESTFCIHLTYAETEYLLTLTKFALPAIFGWNHQPVQTENVYPLGSVHLPPT